MSVTKMTADRLVQYLYGSAAYADNGDSKISLKVDSLELSNFNTLLKKDGIELSSYTKATILDGLDGNFDQVINLTAIRTRFYTDTLTEEVSSGMEYTNPAPGVQFSDLVGVLESKIASIEAVIPQFERGRASELDALQADAIDSQFSESQYSALKASINRKYDDLIAECKPINESNLKVLNNDLALIKKNYS